MSQPQAASLVVENGRFIIMSRLLVRSFKPVTPTLRVYIITPVKSFKMEKRAK